MLTKADKKFLKDNFATKDDLMAMEKRQDKKYSTKDDLKDLRSQITDDIDGKLKIQKREILEEVDVKLDTKLAKQKDEIVKEVGGYVAEIIVPMFDTRDRQVAGV